MLTEPMRQRDGSFVGMLNRARVADPSCLRYFNSLVGREGVPSKDPVRLFGTNRKADDLNAKRLQVIQEPCKRIGSRNIGSNEARAGRETGRARAILPGGIRGLMLNEGHCLCVQAREGKHGAMAGRVREAWLHAIAVQAVSYRHHRWLTTFSRSRGMFCPGCFSFQPQSALRWAPRGARGCLSSGKAAEAGQHRRGTRLGVRAEGDPEQGHGQACRQ